MHYKKSHFDIPPDFKDKETFICAYCPEVFLGKKTLQIHTRKHHGSGKVTLKQYNCNTCKLTFTGKQNFASHCKEVHNDIVPILQDAIKCKSCEMKFTAPNIYIQHHQSHHGG